MVIESARHLEGIAREIHEETGAEPPIDALDLADLCGVETIPWRKAAGLLVLPGHGARPVSRPTIFYPERAQHVRRQGVTAHELGHYVAIRGGVHPADLSDAEPEVIAAAEAAADYLAGALMIPRRALIDDLRELDWDLLEVHARHPNASWQMLVIRCVQVAEASASIWDQGRCTRSYGVDSARLREHHEHVVRVLESGRAERGAVDAYPVFTPGFRRVVVVQRSG